MASFDFSVSSHVASRQSVFVFNSKIGRDIIGLKESFYSGYKYCDQY